MRTYLSPIGYNSTSVTRPLLSNGIDSGDTIVLLRPDTEEDSRGNEAIQDVKRFIKEVEPQITLETERLPHQNFEASVQRCSDVIRAAEGRRIVTLGGGARDILLPFTIAAITHVQLLDTALFFSDINGSVSEWNLPHLTAHIPQPPRKTLAEIVVEPDGLSIPALTDRTDQSKSTITRHVTQLAESDAVKTWTEGKTKHVRSTLTGELLSRTDQ